MPTRNRMPSSGTPASAFKIIARRERERERSCTCREESPPELRLETNTSMPYIGRATSFWSWRAACTDPRQTASGLPIHFH